ncbi:unnamed protein product [Periconia digitata]|uniref:RapZ C-terminal domain-containing protein n=1 Tax=Periconia digitata TaxID=1303443 RepID=A0A9W4XNN6_9PLEO|nr:unnamed protein product [Periconia digitata]
MFPYSYFPRLPVWNSLAPPRPRQPTSPPKEPAKPASQDPTSHQSMSHPKDAPPDHDIVKHNHACETQHPPLFKKPKRVYINTYSNSVVKRSKTEHERVVDSRQPGLKPLLTVCAMDWKPPPREVCEKWSGINEEVQRFVGRLKEARRDMNVAMNETIGYLSRNHDEALIEVCCVQGTHRSVAAAEIMGVELALKGIDTYIRHLHRQKMPQDEW